MDKAKEFLALSKEDSKLVSRIAVHPPRHHNGGEIGGGGSGLRSFYEDFALRGIRVTRVEPGIVVCAFKVPARLTDRSGKLASGAIANLVDEVGGALTHAEGLPMSVSVDMSISFLASAYLDDEIEITGRLLGRKGGYSGTSVLMKNKLTGELIAEGRHSLFGKHASKL